MKKIFISDAHFGAESTEKEKHKAELFYSFLEYFESQDAELYIVGDLFDFWFEYKYAIPRRHFRIIAHLADLCRSGRNIHYLAGNHDFWLGSFMEKEVGLKLHTDDYIISEPECKIYICHGDGLLKNDYGYRFLKRVLRNKLNIWLYRLMHPDFGIPFALFFSNLSREHSKDDENYTDIDYRQYAFNKIDEGYDFVVLGHTHWPAMDKYKNGWYLNAGNWMEKFTFAEIDNCTPRLFKWDGQQAVDAEIEFPPGYGKYFAGKE